MIYYLQSHYDSATNKFSNATTFSLLQSNNAYSGEMKTSTQKRIRKALDIFLQISPTTRIYNPIAQKHHTFRLAFITLTVSSKTIQDHKFCYNNLLKPFIEWLRKTKKVESYIWKAELQERLQIHYHITINCFVDMNEIREKWNYLQRKNRLIKNADNPPSTEIKSVKKIKSIEHYLAKYIAKDSYDNKPINKSNDVKEVLTDESIAGTMLSCYPVTTFNDYSINGKVWDCSINLKSNKYFTIDVEESISKMLIENNIQNEIVKEVYLDTCTVIKCKENYIEKILTGDVLKEYKEFISCVKNGSLYVAPHRKSIKQIAATKAIENFNRIEKEFAAIRNKKQKPSSLAPPAASLF